MQNEVPESPEFYSVRFIVFAITFSGTGFDEEAALLGAGREFALMKTASGKVGVCTIMLFGSKSQCGKERHSIHV